MDKKLNYLIGIGTGVLVLLLISVLSPTSKPLVGGGGGQNDFRSGLSTTTTTSVGLPKIVLTPRSGRKYAVITNTTATIAYLSLNATTTGTNLADSDFTIPLAASGGTYAINPDNLYLGNVWASSSVAVTIRAYDAY
jgi:hypothetical protein